VTPKRVAITGASGLIGSELSAHLSARGDDVVHLVRREPRTGAEIRWDPRQRTLDPAALEHVDAVVHLAGANVGAKRWTPAYKREILTSRVDGTATVAQAIVATGKPIRLVSGSAIGVYGDRGEELLTEDSHPGDGFLTEVVRAWEGAARAAADAGAPVALARTGLVMAKGGGAFAPLLTLGRLGLAGPLGSGRQFWSWISLRDTVRAFVHLVDRPELTGPVNLVGPDPVRQREVVAELGRQLGRPTLLPAPAFAMRLLVGELAGDILSSQRVVAGALRDSGFAYDHATLAAAVRSIL